MTTSTGMKLGVKYCGHCRPFMDMTCIPPLLLESRPELEFGPVDETCCAILVLNACPSSCASLPDHAGPKMVFACEGDNDTARLVSEIGAAIDALVFRTWQKQAVPYNHYGEDQCRKKEI